MSNSSNNKWWVLVAVGVGTFMSALDGSVVNIVLPVVSHDFQTEVATIEWVVTVYLLLVSGMLLSFGRLGDLRGHKSTYVTGFIVFVIGSALCGWAPNEIALILFRALQAIGAAMLFSNAPAILTKNFPPEQRGQALGLQGTMTYLGLTVGPSLGGWLTTQLGWRSVFYINVPVGLIALVLTWKFIPQDEPEDRSAKFDLAGAGLFLVGLVTLLLVLNQGHEWGWVSPISLALFAFAVIVLVSFVVLELRVKHPMLDLSLFQKRLFSASVLSALLNYICLSGVMFLLPFYLIQGRGLDTAQAGMLLTAQPLVMAIIAPISGTLSDRIGARILSTLGMFILAFGMFLLSRLGGDAPFANVAIALAIVGVGVGIFVSPNNSALMGAAPRQRQGIASGVLATARNLGMVLGIGIAGAIFTTSLGAGICCIAASALYSSISAGFVVAIGIAILGGLVSAVR